MSAGTGPVTVPLRWRWLADSPLLVAAWVVLGAGLCGVVQVARSLRAAAGVAAKADEVMALVVAEAAAARLAGPGLQSPPAAVTVGRVPVAVEAQGSEWLLSPRLEGVVTRFRCARLAGGAAPAFAGTLTLGGGAPVPGVELDDPVLAKAWTADATHWFRRDQGVALLHVDVGTEAEDFVAVPSALQDGIDAPVDVLTVPGHLWLDGGRQPLRWRLDHDLTVVVCGNLYLAGSLVVEGTGRLVLVAAPRVGAMAFRDLDGNLRYSPGDQALGEQPFRGPLEGAGGIWLGGDGGGPVRIAAGLVAFGEIAVRGACRVDGPVVGRFGVTPAGGGGSLHPAGIWRFAADRERVPGFLPVGEPRLGRLQPVGGQVDELPLYLAAPSR